MNDADGGPGWDAQSFMIEQPVEAAKLLDAYHLLRGDPGAWWARKKPIGPPAQWAACVQRAITRFAKRSGIPARTLAQLLDEDVLPRTRNAVLALAREYMVAP